MNAMASFMPVWWSKIRTIRLHACLTLSTAESEYVAATEIAKELVVWLRNMLGEIGLPQSEPTTIYEDNQACIVMASQKMVSGRNNTLS